MNTFTVRAVLCCLLALLALSSARAQEESAPSLELVPHPELSTLKPEIRDRLGPAVDYFRGQRGRLEGRQLGLAYGRMGMNYQAWEQQDAAAACYRNAMALDPQNPRWPYLYAVYAEETGDLEGAIANYRKALSIQPTYTAAYARIGRVFLDAGMLREAEAAFEVVLNQSPDAAAGLAGMGEVAAGNGDFERAVGLYRRALEKQPEATQVHYQLGLAYRELGRRDEARAELDKAGQRVPTIDDPLLAFVQALTQGASGYLEDARKAVQVGRPDVALRFYELATSIEPDNTEALVEMGKLQAGMGDTDDALLTFARVLSQQPERPDAAFLVGMIMEQKGQQPEADRYYARALETRPELVQPRMLLANSLMRQGEFSEASEHYSQIIRQLPEETEVQYLLGLAWLADGECELAQQSLLRALKLSKGDGDILVALARAYSTCPAATAEQRQQALDAAEARYGDSPGLAEAETLAMACAANGRFEDAVDFQTQAIFEALKQGDTSRAQWHKTNLALYENQQAATVPFPLSDPVYRPRPLAPSVSEPVPEPTTGSGG
jgi:tetratricopeptide (TPR) repeat protein